MDIFSPIVTVLENTIGNIWFGYEDSASYIINSNGLFTLSKTWAIGGNPAGYNNVIAIGFDNTSLAYITTGVGDDTLNNTPIEIRVYN